MKTTKQDAPGAQDGRTCARTGTRSLADGLLVAQMAIQGVDKDARNKFHNYAYTSAEGMISACRAALHAGGVVARRRSWRIDGDGLYVVSAIELAHGGSGETQSDEIAWPIVIEKGRPVDKAVASALTTSLGYWLRDALCIPREEEDGAMDRRNDRTTETRHGIGRGADDQPPPRPAPAAPRGGRPTATQREEVRDLNQRLAGMAGKAPETPAAASGQSGAPVAAPAAAAPAAAIPGDGTPCILHRVTERSAGGRQFLIAELLHDGATVECVVGPDLSGIVRELVGSVLVPSIVDRGDRMPLLQDVRVAKGGDADGELPF